MTCVHAAQLHQAGPRREASSDRSMPSAASMSPPRRFRLPRARQPAAGRARSSASSTTLHSDRRQIRRAVRHGASAAPRRCVVRAAPIRKRTHRFRLRSGGRLPAIRSSSPIAVTAADAGSCAGSRRRACFSLPGQNIAASFCAPNPRAFERQKHQQLIAPLERQSNRFAAVLDRGEPNRKSRSVISAQESHSACAKSFLSRNPLRAR